MNDIEPNYNDLDPSWTTDFEDILDDDNGELLSDLLSELFNDEDEEEEESDKHPLNELIKYIH